MTVVTALAGPNWQNSQCPWRAILVLIRLI